MFFATNRKLKKPTDPSGLAIFGEESDEVLRYGSANVEITTADTLWSRLKGWLKDRFRSQDPRDDEGKFDVLGADNFFRATKRCHPDDADLKGHGLVFIHGYNTSFQEALTTLGHIVSYLPFDGCAFLFSWPSKGGLDDYSYDKESVELSIKPFAKFLGDLISRSDLQYIHFLAHSMGSKLLTEALSSPPQRATAASAKAKIAEIVFASPDVATELFKQRAPQILDMVNRGGGEHKGVTLLISNADCALDVSRRVNQRPRLGAYDTRNLPFTLGGVDTIDLTNLGVPCMLDLNHSVFLSHVAVRNDIRALFKSGKRPPDERNPNLARQEIGNGEIPFWAFTH